MRSSSPILIIVLACRPAAAEPELGAALRAGPNAATLDEANRFHRYGLSGGLSGWLQWRSASRFSLGLQSDLLYTPRGAQARFDGRYVGHAREYYVDVTLAARPELRFDRTSVHLLLGLGACFLMSAHIEDITGAQTDITGDLHRLDVALLFGAGAALRVAGPRMGPLRLDALLLELRHDRGLINTDAVNGGFHNRTTSLLLGLSFALSSRTSTPAHSTGL